ncbi:MAG: glycosyltransferase family 2 protein [Bacteroidales bacterium]|nr:glycosyltransferase family 2 protein [Bacteroidales bacterium]
MLSVICPIYNEEKYIAACIDSIMEQDYPKDDLEVLLVDGMSTDRTREIIGDYMSACPYLRLLDNPDRIAPCAMNRGIEAARGEVVMRLDAHASYPPDYFSVLVRRLGELEADNVGAVCKTDVLHKTPKTLAIREVLGNRFGVGNSLFRTGISEVRQVDTVPFGCWPREVFEKYGRYDERLVRNQDIELNKRILRGGGKIFLVPDTYSTYYARETFGQLFRNNYGNGKWNILTVYYTGEMRSLSLRHFVPLLFVLSLLLPFIAGFFWHPLWLIGAASLLAYLALVSFVSARLSRTKGLSFLRLVESFMVLHISYGLGSLVGIVTLPFVKQKSK